MMTEGKFYGDFNFFFILHFIFVFNIFTVCGIESDVVGASLMPAVASTPQLAITVIGMSQFKMYL